MSQDSSAVLDGVMLLWWILTIPSFLFVAIDIWRTTPEATVMKWAFVILTAFTGPVGAFFYVLGCREPIRGTHEQYVSARWRQVLGSTMHCAAGDGVGIIAGAAIGAAFTLAFWPDFVLEYFLGFGFGWAFFQAFAMRDMAGGSYSRSLRMTFLPEFMSMNVLMAGMTLVMQFAMPQVPGSHDPTTPAFWFIASMSLLAGFVCAYPMNWWLVSRGMKHGMITVLAKEREPTTVPVPAGAMAGHGAMPGMDPAAMPGPDHAAMVGMDHRGMDHGGGSAEHSGGEQPSQGQKAGMAALSVVILGVALVVVQLFAPAM